MYYNYFIFLILTLTNSFYNYDKILNKDINTLHLRNIEPSFYSSKHLYSSHYINLDLNKSNFSQK